VEIAAPAGGTWLDVATGAGHAAFAVAPYVDKIIASDTSERMLDVALQEANQRNLRNFEVRTVEAHSLPFADAALDGITCRCALHHFANPPQFFAEAHRALRPGGALVLVDTVGSEDATADGLLHELESLRDPTHMRDYTVNEIRDMAEAAGFRLEQMETASKPLNLRDWMDRQNVLPANRDRIIEMIRNSSGSFRDYLNPIGGGSSLTFHLAEAMFRFRKN
jgi:SAM-dependent methyltransferase